MFSLIISIIAIALVAALAAASVYYGGSAFNKGTAGADASTFINNGQQINGAYTLSATDGNDVSAKSVADMVTDGYLSQEPSYKGTAIALDSSATNYVSIAVSPQVCTEILARGGENATAATIKELYGCDKSGGSNTAFYKVR